MKIIAFCCVLSLSLLSACNRGGEVRPGHYVINDSEYDKYMRLMIEQKISNQKLLRLDLLEKYFEVDCQARAITEIDPTDKQVLKLVSERDEIQLRLQKELKFAR